MQPTYPNQGPPPNLANQVRGPPMMSNQYGMPTGTNNPQMLPQQPSFPNPSMPSFPPSTNITGPPKFPQNSYPVGQPGGNAPMSSFPPGVQPPPPSGFPPGIQAPPASNTSTMPPPIHRTSPQPNNSTMPPMHGNQLNGGNIYPHQLTQNHPGLPQQPPSSLPPPSQFGQPPVSHQGPPQMMGSNQMNGSNSYQPNQPPLGNMPPPPSSVANTHAPFSQPPNFSGLTTAPGGQWNAPNAYMNQQPPPPPMGLNQPPTSTPQYGQQPNLTGPPLMSNNQMNGSNPYPGPPGVMPPQHLPPQYGHGQNMGGPPNMANPGGPQFNGPNAYPGGQGPAGGLGQQPFPPPPPQPQRIDPDMVPNVVQVLEQAQEKNQEPFVTNAPGSLPPLVGIDFSCQDQGSCNPRFIRATTYTIPNANDMVKQSQIPLALSISPLADILENELEPPLSNFGDLGPIRCQRCKAYICSYMQFIDGGKRFVCCFCEAATDVPNEYFNHLDHTGRRMDAYQRPELCLGSYEILATKQYCKDEKWPEPPAFIFMIDVSYNSIRSGLVDYICQILKNDLLDFLPKDKNREASNIRVGFVTFDKQIHFYNIKNTLGQPQMMIVSDLEDIFVPLLDGFLCSPQDSRAVITTLLEQIPQNFMNSQETETVLGPVIQSGIQALKGANCTGKLYIFSTSLPIAVAPGKLANRDDKKLLGTDKEKALLSPVNNFYAKLGEECAQQGCAVDLFVFPNNYMDLATIGEVSRLSGGQIYKFNYFSVENDGDRLLDELKRNFQRTTAFDALMRVRTSSGIRPVDFLGNFYMTNTTEMIFGAIDSDKSISVELKHDDKLAVESNTYIQAALLYTSISGQRRLRILTLALTVTSSYTSLYPACDLDAITNYITKVALRSVTVSTPKSIRDNIINQAANMLACYRKNCAQATTAGQLILPETLKLLPVYVASLIKCDALTGTQTVTTDDRSYLMHRLMSMGVKSTFAYLYPRIYALHTLEDGQDPPMIRCSFERFTDTGAYVIENGLSMYIWLGSNVSSSFVQSLFGVQAGTHFQAEKCRIVELDNPISRNVRNLLNKIRNERNSFMRLFVIKQTDSLEPFFKNYLVEDKGFTGGASYVDFLYHLHREIRNILQ